MTALLADGLDKTTVGALDDLYMGQDGYAITPLKHDPKDFSLRETKLEIARSQSLDALYQKAKAILPELGISNDSVPSALGMLISYQRGLPVLSPPTSRKAVRAGSKA